MPFGRHALSDLPTFCNLQPRHAFIDRQASCSIESVIPRISERAAASTTSSTQLLTPKPKALLLSTSCMIHEFVHSVHRIQRHRSVAFLQSTTSTFFLSPMTWSFDSITQFAAIWTGSLMQHSPAQMSIVSPDCRHSRSVDWGPVSIGRTAVKQVSCLDITESCTQLCSWKYIESNHFWGTMHLRIPKWSRF